MTDSGRDRGALFDRVLATGFYDGVTAGVAVCATCGSEFRLDLLDWSRDQDVRVFSAAPLQRGSLHALIRACPGEPRWPVWAPVWTGLSDSEIAAAEREIDAVISTAGPPAFVVATTPYLDRVLTFKDLTGEDWALMEAAPANSRDWLAYLGLP
jgi:hypothetical protein